MTLVALTRAFLVITTIVVVAAAPPPTPPDLHKLPKCPVIKPNNETCAKLAKHPFFKPDLVLGEPWRVYYMWNTYDGQFVDDCLEVSFVHATPEIVNSYYNNTHEYLESQPDWNAPALLATTRRLREEGLVLAEPGSPGYFIMLHKFNMNNSINEGMPRIKRPLTKFYMRLLMDGKYLIIAECTNGLTFLSSRRDQMKDRGEVNENANLLGLGEGSAACIKNPIIADVIADDPKKTYGCVSDDTTPPYPEAYHPDITESVTPNGFQKGSLHT